ncbi:oligosaccharide flippase family protein [Marinobacter sp.]|uniref:oligosaccharide flippase family protein n=1 Tax=Marinobacter sp. TaxID=50741 RepID=UPI001B402830|nr:oligosaccharide flippase family protein [Marinobacter sp.]MBQ0831291.1 oligosaccharide flippase family protein [Marinobacter sp.]
MARVLKNASWLTVSHLAGYAIPLIELPVLTRSLGPDAYGKLLFAQSLALSLSLIVEYGFNLSASRAVARNREDPVYLRKLFGSVILAKLLITFFLLLFCIAWYLIQMPQLANSDWGLAGAAAVFFLAFGFSPFWYFQGTERMLGPVMLDLAFRFTGVILLYLFIHEPEDSVLALVILAVAGLCNTLITTGWALSRIGRPQFELAGAWLQICEGWHTFVYRSSSSVLLSASPAVLGFSAGTLATGIFVPAEKLIRASTGLALPVLTAFFPYLSRLSSAKDSRGNTHGWMLVGVLTLGGAIGAVLLWYLAPWLVLLLAGESFEASAGLMSLFVWLLPLRMLSQSLGLAILLPQGDERFAGYTMICSAILAVALGVLFSGWYGAIGMVSALLVAEAMLVLLLLYRALRGRSQL